MNIVELKKKWNAKTHWDNLNLEEMLIFAQQECLKEAAERFQLAEPCAWVCSDGYSNGEDIAVELRHLATKVDWSGGDL